MALYKGVGPRISRVCCEVAARGSHRARPPTASASLLPLTPRGTLCAPQVAITMSLYGEVVKMLNKYWITADQLEKPKGQLMTSSSVLVEVPKGK